MDFNVSDSKKKTTKKRTPQYEATLRILGKEFKSKGGDIESTLHKLRPGNVSGMAILTVKKGDRSRERILRAVQSRRIFNTNGINKDILIKQTSLLFGDL